MKRRDFLFGATALTLPAWLGCAFSSKSEWSFDDSDYQKGSTIGKAFLQAQSLGKPLLIFVVPPLPFTWEQRKGRPKQEQDKYDKADIERYERGHAFGEFLNHASEVQRWPLALCEVICALPEEIEYLTGPLAFSGAPLMALIETDSKSPNATAVDGVLPPLFSERVYFEDYEDSKKNEEKLINKRIDLIAKLLKDAIAPDQKAIERRAKQVRAALATAKELEKKISTKGFGVPEADVIAAIVAEAAYKTKSINVSARFMILLAQAVDERLRKPPIEGSRWANSSGCGTTYEDPPKPKVTNTDGEIMIESVVIVGCGMGHIPEKSQRFLSFYTEEST